MSMARQVCGNFLCCLCLCGAQISASEVSGQASSEADAPNALSIAATSTVVTRSPTGALLNNERVLNELGLTPEQREQTHKLIMEYAKRRFALSPSSSVPSALFPQNFADRNMQMLRVMSEVGAECHQLVEAILSREQLLRLRQIQLQLCGYSAFVDSDVVRELNLTADEAVKMKTIIDVMRNRVNRHLKSLATDQLRRQEIETESGRAMEDCVASLTAEELAAWRRLLGQPVRFGRADLDWAIRFSSR